MKNCGSCKWLDVPASHLVKGGRTHKRHDYRAYPCTVPFEMPPFPSCFDVTVRKQNFSCPRYGTECAFHEPRSA